MKRIITVKALPLVAAAALLLASCSNFLVPVKGFLKEYTENAAIEDLSFLVPVQVDSEGYTSVRSGEPASLRFLMRNPQRYNLAVSLVFDDAGITATAGTDYSFALAADKQSLELTFSDAFLRAHDPAGNLSGTVTITDPGTGRAFLPYRFSLRSNSPPPRPSGLRIMQNTGTYVVCFNLDLSDSVQGDIAGVYVDSKYYPVQTVTAGGSQSITFASADAGTSVPAGLAALPGGGTFIPDTPNQIPVYVEIKEAVAVDNREFAVRVVDSKGLESSAVTSSKGTRLGAVQLYDAEGSLLSASPTLVTSADTGLAGLEIRAPSVDANGDPVSDVTVEYEISRSTGLYANGYEPGSATLSLGKNSYMVRAWASKSGYLDSDVFTSTVVVKGTHLYVHPTSGDDASGDGSRVLPYKTIRHTFSTVPAGSTDVFVFHLMDNITAQEAGAAGTDQITLNLGGNRNIIIDGAGHYIDGQGVRRCLYVNATGLNLTLQNITIQNGYSVDMGAGINYYAGLSLIISDGSRITGNKIVSSGESHGAGLSFRGTKLEILDSVIDYNENTTSGPYAYGAGISVFNAAAMETIVIASTQISNNILTCTSGGGYARGAGISINARNGVRLDAVIIRDNINVSSYAGRGGGLYYNGWTATSAELNIINGSSFSGNIVRSNHHAMGGGFYTEGYYVLNLTNSTFSSNTLIKTEAAGDVPVEGAGICISTGAGGNSLVVTSCNISNNSIKKVDATIGDFFYGYGSGIACYSVVFTSQGNTIQGNTISGTANGYGGGVLLPQSNTATIINTRIIGNTISASNMGLGGGLAVYGSGSATIKGGEITGNTANTTGLGNGGGIYTALSATCTIGDTLFTTVINGNTASGNINGHGGGIYIEGGTNTIQGNTIISNNIAAAQAGGQSQGGAVMVQAGSVTFNGCYAENNIALQGSGVFINSFLVLYLQGTTQFAQTNDIFFITTGQIWLLGELDPLIGADPKTARLTPSAYGVGTPILSGDISGPYANNYTFFTVTPYNNQNWIIDSGGLLQPN